MSKLADRSNLVYLRMVTDALFFRRLVWKKCQLQAHNLERLPKHGPALLVSTHSSHMDAGVIQVLFPLTMLPRIRPSGARDHFTTKGFGWHLFARGFMRLLFVDRSSGELAKAGKINPFAELHVPLTTDVMVIVFPQGTRDPTMSFKSGIVHLSRMYPEVPVIPILLRGTEAVLPPNTVGFRPGPLSVYVGERYTFDPTLSAADNVKKLEEYIYSLDQV
jgi:1-acyl-sn-glycerol-3-phosphate acyltransferase